MTNDRRTSLVYYRHAGEGIEIGGVTVKVLQTGPKRCRLQVVAPAEVRVRRTEVASKEESTDA